MNEGCNLLQWNKAFLFATLTDTVNVCIYDLDNFQQTLEFIRECRFDTAYTFIYSRRSGTPAAKMTEQIDARVKKERLLRLMEIQDPISLSINQEMLDKSFEIMIEGPSKNDPSFLSGRTDGNKIVIFKGDKNATEGQMRRVKITEARTWNLIGELE